MNTPTLNALGSPVDQTQISTIEFELNGRTVQANSSETLLQVAQREQLEIPHLCYKPGLEAVGNCRACMVEIEGERVLAASCCRTAQAGMKVNSQTPRALSAQKMVLELLLSDAPSESLTRNNELLQWAVKSGIRTSEQYEVSRFASPASDTDTASDVACTPAKTAADNSHAAISVNLDACILCTRCVRACRDEQVNDVIGLAMRGGAMKVSFDMDDSLGNSSCVACGECVQACPTGALMPAQAAALPVPDQTVASLCPFCGVGCQVNYHVKDNKITYVEGRDGPANHYRLCVKGRYGFDYAHHAQRLTQPLIRRSDAPKHGSFTMDPDQWMQTFRPASWEEAMALTAEKLLGIREQFGKKALAGFGSAKGSNEEAYLFQKLVRTGFGSNNVDHCTRLCHASSVAALLEGIGSGGVSNPVMDVGLAEVVIVIGANPTVNHPVAATWLKNAMKQGCKLILCDPRRSELARSAEFFLQFKPDTDVALLNAMMHVIVEEGLVDQDFIDQRTEGFEEFKANLQHYQPELMAAICGIPADTIREVARLYAKAKTAMILWGMGVSQHIHGTDNARCLIALALMTGQIGRPGTGLHPLRGQNNVQGASDAGLIPMMYPDYQRVTDPAAQEKFKAAWNNHDLDTAAGLTVVEIMHAILEGQDLNLNAKSTSQNLETELKPSVAGKHNPHQKIHGMYIMGENPAMSDPDVNHARKALAALDFLVVQDIFLTETAYLADVILPASVFVEKDGSFTNTDRTVQLGRAALKPPGQARQDVWIIQDLAQRMGLNWNYQHVSEVFDEMRHVMPSIGGITWQRLEQQDSVTYPCLHEGDPGEPVVFQDSFPRESGRARFVAADIIPANEKPDENYPMVLITGRQLEHWHTGSMTRRSAVLDALEPDPVALVHSLDLAAMGMQAGEVLTLESRRGKVCLYARADDSSPRGAIFVPFCYYEAAINKLTNAALDPFGKIPEFKYCAIRATPGGQVVPSGSYGGGQILANQKTVSSAAETINGANEVNEAKTNATQ